MRVIPLFSALVVAASVSLIGCEPADGTGTGTTTGSTTGMDGDMEASDAEGTIDSGSSGAVRGPGDGSVAAKTNGGRKNCFGRAGRLS